VDNSFSDAGHEDDAAEGGTVHRRAAERHSLFLHATLRRGDGPPLTMRIRNLSSGGMMAEIGEPFENGDHVAIELRGIGSLDGTVMWREDKRIGIAFAREIDPRMARKTVAVRTAATPATVAPRTVRRTKLFGD
jgi:hypothetical protein